MKRHDTQAGFALLLMLLVLFSGGVALMLPMLPERLAIAPTGQSLSTAYGLQSARQSLLVYATLYPYLYGPRGAGPGHLPCPDVRGSDGPDPPCGNMAPASGRLARHVSVSGQRYAFDADSWHRHGYSVDSGLINNPLNRVVNDAVLDELAEVSPYVAWVEDDSIVSQVSAQGFRAPVSARAMIPGLKLLAATWMLERINREDIVVCPEFVADQANDVEHALQDWVALIADATVTTSSSCAKAEDAESVLSELQIDGVPAASHWFIRNRWHERMTLSSLARPLSLNETGFR